MMRYQASTYYISMLPSATEISKKCLITGQPEPFKGSAYEGPVKGVWESALKDKKVHYLPHIGALRAVRTQEHDVYFLNYLPIDIAFHQDLYLQCILFPNISHRFLVMPELLHHVLFVSIFSFS